MKDLSPIDWAVLPMKKYAQFSGRAPRAEYWWFYLGTIVASIPVAILDKVLGDTGALSGIFNLAILLPWLGVTVRRLHDTDRTGWWLLLLFIPFLAAGVMVGFLAAQARLNGTASDPFSSMGAVMIASIAGLIFLVILVIVFLALPGTVGPNRYGADPYDNGSNLEEVFA
jgi:uncharacterized membrane protein YhaH (DUF805 family)